MLMEFYERVSGARMHANYFRPGGVARDMPAGLAEDIGAWTETFPKVVADIETLLNDNRIYKQRTVDIGNGLVAATLEVVVGPHFANFVLVVSLAHFFSLLSAGR